MDDLQIGDVIRIEEWHTNDGILYCRHSANNKAFDAYEPVQLPCICVYSGVDKFGCLLFSMADSRIIDIPQGRAFECLSYTKI